MNKPSFKQFFGLFLKWAAVNLIFVAITVISAGWSSLHHFYFTIPSAGLIYLIIYGFWHSNRKGLIFSLTFVISGMLAMFMGGIASLEISHYVMVNQAIIFSAVLMIHGFNKEKPVLISDALIMIALAAIFGGIGYLYIAEDLFGALRIVTILGYGSALAFLILIGGFTYLLKPLLRFMFGIKKSGAA